MVKVNIISGFLGAGKTTLIKKLLSGAMKGEKVILLENEYGEVGVDSGFMKDAGIYSYGGIETVTAEAIREVYGMEADIIEHRGNKLIVPL